MTDHLETHSVAPLLPAEEKAIRRALRGVRRSSPVRPIAQEILAGVTPGSEAAATLIDAIHPLGRRQAKDRLLAAWCIGFVPMSAAQRTLAADLLGHILDGRPARPIGCLIASGCFFAYLGWVLILYASVVDTAKNRPRLAAAASLGRLAAPQSAEALCRAIAPMGSSAASGDGAVRRASAIALASVARALPNGGYGQIPADTIQSLCRMFATADNHLIFWLLQCLRQFGGSSAIPAVERAIGRIREPGLSDHAQKTLLVLRERARQETDRARLLRPSSAPATQADRLLRPVENAADADPDRLLRPSDPPDGGQDA